MTATKKKVSPTTQLAKAKARVAELAQKQQKAVAIAAAKSNLETAKKQLAAVKGNATSKKKG